MLGNLKKVNPYYLLLFAVIAVQVIYISVLFGMYKQGFHSDELWNYGFANSSTGLHISMNDDSSAAKNANEWRDSKELNDYISVSREERFDYVSAYRNASHDYNPPFGYMLLHFVCSFFTDKWSKWYCFALNMACFVILQIYLFRLACGVTKRMDAGILAVYFFGFTTGALDIFTFLRIYAPGVTLSVMGLYYAAKLYDTRDEKKHGKLLFTIFVVNFLGFMTLHAALVAAFIITLMYCLYYLFTKRFKLMFQYGFVMLGSVAASFAAYPRVIYNLFGVEQHTYTSGMYPLDLTVRTYWSYITNDLFGVHNSMWKTMTLTYCILAVFLFLFVTMPLAFVFRNEVWLKKLLKNIAKALKFLWQKIKRPQYTIIVLIVTVSFIIFTSSTRTSIYTMGRYANRYIFIAYPMLAVFAVTAVYSVMIWIIKKRNVRNIIAVILCFIFSSLSIFLAEKPYYFEHEETGIKLTDIERDANCIVMLTSDWLLTCMTNEIGHTGQYFLTTYDEAFNTDYKLETLDESKPLYLLMDTSMMNYNPDHKVMFSFVEISFEEGTEIKIKYKKDEYLDFYKKLNGVTKMELVGTDEAFGRYIEVYRLN